MWEDKRWCVGFVKVGSWGPQLPPFQKVIFCKVGIERRKPLFTFRKVTLERRPGISKSEKWGTCPAPTFYFWKSGDTKASLCCGNVSALRTC